MINNRCVLRRNTGGITINNRYVLGRNTGGMELLYIGIFIFFFAIFMLIYGVLSITLNRKLVIEERIEQIKELNNGTQEETLNKSFSERAVQPLYNALSKFFLKATPTHKLAVMTKKLERAGLLRNTTTERWLFTKNMVVLTAGTLFGLLSIMVEPNILKAIIIAAIIMLFINTFFGFFLSKRIESRKNMILKDLPYTLDLITVSVEAGLSFDGAMARVVNNINGALCDEFGKSLKEIRMGIERKVALRNMSNRCDVRELSMLITSLIQADDLGVSLGKVLRIESANLREHRKQAAREKAMKAPIKMLFPLIFFIFPSIFIIILGPAVIRMLNIFMAK